MTDAEKDFELELEALRIEAESASQYIYAVLAIHETAERYPEVEKLLNTAPLFWNTTLGALQTSAFIALGRIFDDDSRSHRVRRLFQLAKMNPEIFARERLLARRQANTSTKPECLDGLIAAAYEPIPADYEFLDQEISKHEDIYAKVYKVIRHKIFAHRDRNVDARSLFEQTNIEELQNTVLFFQSLHDILWQLFHNGRKPDLRRLPNVVANMISGPTAPGQQARPHERVAYQVANFLVTSALGGKNTKIK